MFAGAVIHTPLQCRYSTTVKLSICCYPFVATPLRPFGRRGRGLDSAVNYGFSAEAHLCRPIVTLLQHGGVRSSERIETNRVKSCLQF
jgi:hypothetical protein